MVSLLRRLVIQTVMAGLALLITHPTQATQAIGPVTDPIGVIRIPAGAPIQIGGYWVLSGPDTALGLDSKRGVEIAIAGVGGRLLGHPIQLNAEDDLCSAEGGQTAAIKLASNPQTVAVLGSACSSATTPAAPILWQAGITNICTGCTAPSLTAPNRGPAYGGFLRTIANDGDQGVADARYLYEVVKARTIVTLHDGSPYAQELTSVVAANFTRLGGKVLSREAIAPTDIDMHPVLTRIASEKPDALFMPIFIVAAAQILRQSMEVPGLERTTLVGGSSLAAADFIEAAGPSVIGFRICMTDISANAMGTGYPAFVDKYKKMYGEGPISNGHANAYDAAFLVFKAIEQVAKSDKAGNLYIGKKALRDAAFAVKFDGVSGRIACDPYGECEAFKPAVYEFVSDDPKTFSIGTNPKKVWP